MRDRSFQRRGMEGLGDRRRARKARVDPTRSIAGQEDEGQDPKMVTIFDSTILAIADLIQRIIRKRQTELKHVH